MTKTIFGEEYAKLLAQHNSGNIPARIRQHTPINPDWRILDVGCGYGRTVNELRESGITATGIDINEWLIAHYGSPYCEVGDVCAMTFADNIFDLVISVGVLEHILEYDRAISEMVRVSRNLIYIEITTTAQAHNLYLDKTHCVFMSPAEWRAALEVHATIISEQNGNRFLLKVKQ